MPPSGSTREGLTGLVGDSAESFRLLFANHPQAMWVYDLETLRFLEVNDAAIDQYGWTRDEFRSMTIKEVRPPEDVPRLLEELRHTRPGYRRSGLWRHKRKDGSMRDVEILSHTLEFAGRPAVLVVAQDVTDRKKAEDALRQSEREYRGLFENADSAILVFDPDTEKVMDVNPRACELYGIPREEFVGLSLESITKDVASGKEAIRRIVREGRIREFRTVHFRNDGTEIHFEVNAAAVTYHGRPAVLTLLRDISEERRAETALRESEERYALAARGANDGLWDWNLPTNEVYYSPRWRQMVGDAEDGVGTSPEEWFDRVPEEDSAALQRAIVDHLEGRAPHLEVEHRVRRDDGEERWMLVRGLAVRDGSGRATRMAGWLTDITDRKRAEEQIRRMAYTDPMTGAANRARFLDELGRCLAAGDAGPLVSVLLMDLDRFQQVNQSLGHAAGDRLLSEIARRLQACVGPRDFLARLGGDEFTVLLRDIASIRDVSEAIERILRAFESPFALDDREVYVSLSSGVVFGCGDYEHPEDVLRDAESALLRAKSRGKARHEIFDPSMHRRAVDLLELETDLRRAVERDEFVVYYQPIIALPGGRIAGFEALVRWRHPTRGLLSPVDFLPATEETALILPIGERVLREAVRQVREWEGACPQAGRLSMSVNLSSRQFAYPQMVRQVASALSDSGLDPAQLRLEITESVVMDDAAATIETLEAMKKLGVQLVIDDFGTGYSSLGYLHRFPIDTLKIDRSFVGKMSITGENLEIIRTIVTLAHNLHKDIVAEGVEQPEQVAQLSALRCEYAQGYFFSPPIPAADAGRMVQDPPRWWDPRRPTRGVELV